MFPELFDSYLRSPIPERAVSRRIADIRILDIKTYAGGSFRHIDDDTYGGGAGAVLRARPVLSALRAALTDDQPEPGPVAPSAPPAPVPDAEGPSPAPDTPLSPSVYSGNRRRIIAALTPVGRLYDQQTAERYQHLDHLILICGHYEGLDERIYHHVDERISIGDYILTGGELASQVVMDSILRLLPGVLRAASTADESFSSRTDFNSGSGLPESIPAEGAGACPSGKTVSAIFSGDRSLLEYPQYTRPADLDGDKVPSVLLSGDHEAIRRWRLKESLRATLQWRPDLLAAHPLTEEEQRLLAEIRQEETPSAASSTP